MALERKDPLHVPSKIHYSSPLLAMPLLLSFPEYCILNVDIPNILLQCFSSDVQLHLVYLFKVPPEFIADDIVTSFFWIERPDVANTRVDGGDF